MKSGLRVCCGRHGAGAGFAVLLFEQEGFLMQSMGSVAAVRLLHISAEGLRLFQELSQGLFLGVGRQKGVGTGNFLLEVYK